MKKYLIESKNTDGDIFFGYNEDGLLVYFEAKGEVSKLQVVWLHNHLQLRHEDFEKMKKKIEKTGAKVIEVVPDLSFDFFWSEYDYKKGKKPTVKRIWVSMPDPQKVKALMYLKKYNHHLSVNTHIQRLYPQSYLNRQEWNN